MPTSEAPDDWVWLARLRRPQGRKGELWAEILTDFPERFASRKQLWLLSGAGPSAAPRLMPLANHWMHKGGVVLHFAGVDSISAAEVLAGLLVAIPRAERAPLGEDEFYIGDLIGSTLVDVTPDPPRVVGPIREVDTTAGPVALLVVNQPGSAEEALIPFAKSYLRRVAAEARRIEMALPEGLVDLNA